MLQPFNLFLWPFVGFAPVRLCLSFTGVNTALQMSLTMAEQRGKITSLDLLAKLFSYAGQYVVSPLPGKGTLLTHAQLVVHQNPWVFFCQTVLQPVGP